MPDLSLRPSVDLAIPLERLPDAWVDLRRLHAAVAVGTAVTLHFGVERPRMTATDAAALVRLAGFDVLSAERTAIRARAAEVHVDTLRASVIVPCRDEIGNVDAIVRRVPQIGDGTELIFVDGASADGTPERIEELISEQPERHIRLIRQTRAMGKASAVFEGFDAAGGDVLIILDADMTVAPEDLERFFLALAEGHTRFANGTRFAYPMTSGAMPVANVAGNRIFSRALSLILGTSITDTLCGTKALFRVDWQRLRAVRHLFGGQDPWGDFDLLLGAAYLGLNILDVPIRYGTRMAGESKMHPFRDGWVLGRTCLQGARRLRSRDCG